MTTPGDAIVHTLSRLRDRANAFIVERLAAEGVTDLAPSHGAILDVLYRHGPQPMRFVSEHIHRDKSTLTVLVRKLEAQGYVRRGMDGGDARVAKLSLTAKGKAFQQVFERISVELRGTIWGDTPTNQRADLMDHLVEMIERLEE